jgi:hypothetical protein
VTIVLDVNSQGLAFTFDSDYGDGIDAKIALAPGFIQYLDRNLQACRSYYLFNCYPKGGAGGISQGSFVS